MNIKLSKKKKIILTTIMLGTFLPLTFTPIIVNSFDNKDDQKMLLDKKDVTKIIKIFETKSNDKTTIILPNDSKGKIIADNKEKIIKKIKKLIGNVNLKGVSIEISMTNDQEISTSFEEIKVKISKGSYSQEFKKDKKIFVKRSETISELALIKLNLIKTSLKALETKVVNVYTSGSIDQKISTNKLEILEAIEKINGYLNINFQNARIEVKNSEDLLPKHNQDPVPIILVISNSNASVEITGFKAKQMSPQQVAKIDLNLVKKDLESLSSKIVKIDSSKSIDQKITTNKVKIREEIQKLNGYSSIDLKGVSINVKDSETFLPANDQDSVPIIIILAKGGNEIEISGFKAKSLSSQQILENNRIVNLVKSNLETLRPKIVEVYTSGAINQKVTTNKVEILNAIKKISGYDAINLNGAFLEVKNSEALLPTNDQIPINITLVLSKPGVSIEVSGFKAKQMSPQQIANIDLNLVKKDLESLSSKTIKIDSSELVGQKINTNKNKILEAIKKIDGYSKINFRGSNLKIKNSNQNLPSNEQEVINITLIISKNNVNFEVEGFSVKQWSYVIENIKSKIINKNILVKPYVSTSTKIQTQNAILNQLKIQNPSLTNKDLSRISVNINTLERGFKLQVELMITFNQKIEVININVEKIDLLKNSNILDGKLTTMFEDHFGNLWAMGSNTKLQVFKKDINLWSDDVNSDLTKDSNIINGRSGTIFQDKFKNLWTMGYGTSLQVLKANQSGDGYEDSWKSDNTQGLLNGSNITNGRFGKIFQDDFGNLWAMGFGTKLQVLEINESGNGYVNTWDNDNSSSSKGLLKNSNIEIDNPSITIFQDQFKNLRTKGYNQKLQVLKAKTNNSYVQSWTDNNQVEPLLKGSNITNTPGLLYIFQDKFKNLWAMSKGTKLQVLKVNNFGNDYVESWTNDNGENGESLLKGSNIINGEGGFIFQDFFGNLWSVGYKTKLQVLLKNKNGNYNDKWTNDNEKEPLKGLNIDIKGGDIITTIFQDKLNNLWISFVNSENHSKKLFVWVLESKSNNSYVETWTNNNEKGILRGLNFVSGLTNHFVYAKAMFFEDSSKNLWVTKENNRLFVLIKKEDGSYVDSWIN